MDIKAISLWNPWAVLVMLEEKKWETRSWTTPYRGILLIHAAKRYTESEKALCRQYPFFACLIKAGYLRDKPLPFGAYICAVDLVDILPTKNIRNELSQQELAFGDYSDGRYAWQLGNVRVFHTAIPARGYQALWTPVIDFELLPDIYKIV